MIEITKLERNDTMSRRVIAFLLAALLIAGMPSALSETVEIAVAPETDGVVFEDGTGPLSDAVMPSPGGALSIDGLAPNVLSNDADDDDALPIELSVSKSCTRRVTLGLSYQIVIPGKTVICAVGQRSNRAAVDELRYCAPFVREIGDCARVSNITNAIYQGYHAALDI